MAVAALLLVLLGSAIDNRSIYYDEAITLLQLAGNPRPEWPERAVPVETLKPLFEGPASPWEVTRDLLLYDTHPPLYYWTAMLWQWLFGAGLEALRWLSALCVIAQALLLQRYSTQLRRPLLAALLYSVCAVTIMYGSLTRDYAMASLFILIAMLAASQPFNTRNAVIAGLAGGLALGAHYFSFLPIGVVAAYYLWRYWKEREKAALIPAALIGAAGLAGAPFIIRQGMMRREMLAGFQGWGVELKSLTVAFLHSIAPEPGVLGSWLGWAAVALTLAAVVAGFLRDVLADWRRDPRPVLPATIFAAQMFGLYLMAAVGDKSTTYDQTPRYISLVLPAAVILICRGIDLLPKQASLVVASALIAFQFSQVRFGQDLRMGTARQSAAAATAGTTVVVGAGWGRGVPGAVAYELGPGVRMCTIRTEESCADSLDRAIVVRTPTEVTRDAEESLLERCRECRVFKVDSANFP